MNKPVFTLTYDHRHGVDTMVFASHAAALALAVTLIEDELDLEDVSGEPADNLRTLLKDENVEGALRAFNALRWNSSRASTITIEETGIIG